MNDRISLHYFVEQIVNMDAVAVEASKTGVQKCMLLITIYDIEVDEVPNELLQTKEVYVRGIPTQVELEFSEFGVNNFDGISIYASESVQPDGSEISIEEGLSNLYDEFGYYAEERAEEEIKDIFSTGCEKTDTGLLREVARHTNPVASFSSPLRDAFVELYQINGHPYYLYTDGGMYESYRGSELSPTTTEMVQNSKYWQSTNEAISSTNSL